jgi:hypothetical protein
VRVKPQDQVSNGYVCAVAGKAGGLFATAGAAASQIQFHEAPGHELHHLPQHVEVVALLAEPD